MKTSAAGRKALMLREGFKTKAYKDTKGIWTIGVGHTSAAGPPLVTSGLTLSEQEVSELFARDLVKYEKTVNDSVKVPLNQNQYDACVSLCYNIGQGGFAKSTVVKRLNAGDTKGAAEAFLMWNKPVEILGRRRGEYQQFLAKPAEAAEEPVESHPAPEAPVVAKTTDTPSEPPVGLFMTLLRAALGIFQRASVDQRKEPS